MFNFFVVIDFDIIINQIMLYFVKNNLTIILIPIVLLLQFTIDFHLIPNHISF